MSAHNVLLEISQALEAGGSFELGDGVAPAITQTYATASATHANHTFTAHTYPASGNMFDATAADLLINVRTDSVANAVADVVVNEKSIAANLNQLGADVTNVKQVLNKVIDALQAQGLLG